MDGIPLASVYRDGRGAEVEFGEEDRQRSGGTKPSALNPWQWEEENV